jgi:hypothetical protein
MNLKDLIGNRMSRRMLFRAASAVGIARFLPSVLISRAEAASAIPRRIIFIHSHNGVMPSAWNMSISNGMVNLGGAYAALNAHRADINVIEGMRYVSSGMIAGHVSGGPSFLTNTRLDPYEQNNGSARATGQSVDVFIARALASKLGLGIDMRGLLLPMSMGDQWGGGEHISYEAAKTPIKAISDPAKAFDLAFGKPPPLAIKTTTNMTPNTSYESKDREYREKKSVIDFVLQDFESIRSKLSLAERSKVEEHFQAVRDIEKNLIRPDEPTGDGFDAPACPTTRSFYQNDPGNFRRFCRIAMEAMACGQTQVSVIRFTGGVINGANVNNSLHHQWHHGEGSSPEANHNLITAWQAEEIAWLLSELKSRKEAGVPMLDNTLVVWSNEIGIGPFQEHGPTKLPIVLAGRCGGYFTTGKFVQVPQRSHSQLLVSSAKALGIGGNLTGFGDMNGCNPGELTEIKA